MSGPICFSQIPSKSARDSTKDSCLCFERLKTLFVALFQQRLEFIRKAEKVFGFVAFGAQFFFSSRPKKNGALKIRPALFFGNVKTSGKAREVKRCLFFFLFLFGSAASRGAACRLWVGFFFFWENSLTAAWGLIFKLSFFFSGGEAKLSTELLWQWCVRRLYLSSFGFKK